MQASRVRMLGRDGLTIMEVLVAAAILGIVCLALLLSSSMAWRTADNNRILTEARSFAREGLETATAAGVGGLLQSNTVLNAQTNISSTAVKLVRTAEAYWHNADGSLGTLGTNVYAEVHMHVRFLSPLTRSNTVTTLTGLVR